MTDLVRGRVYAAVLSERIGEKPYLVVSNNRRNRALDSVIAVRVATSPKPDLASIVATTPEDPVAGRVLCDDLVEIWPDEVRRDMGACSPATMRRVGDGLRAALGLT
ncbi:MAG: type II toxin-antitoxin system PemK/MazF family toxin [Frankiaceae bacterium]|nr:type II toxin-antitoxin system PemK/MazF family toxin [Frankiaceae bacterium]MBV9368498.1 type II toxin-antitoxin system PemK/MazF family toxin [Frankiales bacterium]